MSNSERGCTSHEESEKVTEVVGLGIILVICKPKGGCPHVLDAYGFGLPSFENIARREIAITNAFSAWMRVNECRGVEAP